VTRDQHLSPEIIAAYLANETSAAERRTVQRHLLTCVDCRGDVDAAAIEMETGRRVPRWVAAAIPLAAAAGVALLLIPGGPSTPIAESVRGPAGEGVRQFAAIAPVDGALVPGDSLAFIWHSESSDAHYVLTVTDDNGDVIWRAQPSDTVLTPPRGVGLADGHRYYWYVDALLEGGRSSTTGVRSFEIRP
jgi:hypothetical protein